MKRGTCGVITRVHGLRRVWLLRQPNLGCVKPLVGTREYECASAEGHKGEVRESECSEVAAHESCMLVKLVYGC